MAKRSKKTGRKPREGKPAGHIQWLICAALLLAVAAVYWQAPSFGFVNLDDDNYVYDNPHVIAGPRPDSLIWAFTSFDHSNWHPVTWISLMLDARLGGGTPTAFHLTNVALHAANAVILFLLLSSLTGNIWRSAFVSALFAVHPLHVESVAWVTERKDVLSTLFWLLTTLAYVSYVRKPSGRRYLVILLPFALGLMSKPMLVSLPLTLLLLDYWPLGRLQVTADGETGERTSIRRVGCLVFEKLPLLAMAAGSAVVTYVAQSSTGATTGMQVWPLGVRMANAAVSAVAYIAKTLWPTGLAAYYPHPGNTIPIWQVVGSAMLLAAVTVAAAAMRKKFPFLLVGWMWYLITLMPVIGIVQVGTQAMADRYTYVPLIGIFLIAAWGIPSIRFARPARSLLPAASVAVLLVLSFAAHRQAATWHDSEKLFSHAISVSDRNYVAHHNLAWHLLNRNPPDIDRAIYHCLKALRAYPEYPNAHNTLGMAYARKSNFRKALEQFIIADRLCPNWPEAINNIGTTLVMIGRYEEALTQIDRAIKLKPELVGAHCSRALALNGLGRRREAIAEIETLLRKHPGDPLLRQTLNLLVDERG